MNVQFSLNIAGLSQLSDILFVLTDLLNCNTFTMLKAPATLFSEERYMVYEFNKYEKVFRLWHDMISLNCTAYSSSIGVVHITTLILVCVLTSASRYPHLLRIDRHLQVICYESRCHPIWVHDYHNMSRDHVTDNSLANWKNDVNALHWTFPNPKELTNEATLRNSSGLFADVGRYVLEKAGLW